MQIRPTAFTIGLIIHPSIALFSVYTEFGIDSKRQENILPFYVQSVKENIIIQAQEVFSEYPEHHCLLFRRH